MADLLVRLYDLPPAAPAIAELADRGVVVRRAAAAERSAVVAFARAHGSEGWANECEVSFARQPVGCFVAAERAPAAPAGGRSYARPAETLIGFACVEATARDFFGPELVHPERRGRGVGRALLLAALEDLRQAGYAYAIIGWASSPDFYRRAVGATVIEGSEPGIYPPPLKPAG
jgi:GNAT superfamily N-acetyltransferase